MGCTIASQKSFGIWPCWKHAVEKGARISSRGLDALIMRSEVRVNPSDFPLLRHALKSRIRSRDTTMSCRSFVQITCDKHVLKLSRSDLAFLLKIDSKRVAQWSAIVLLPVIPSIEGGVKLTRSFNFRPEITIAIFQKCFSHSLRSQSCLLSQCSSHSILVAGFCFLFENHTHSSSSSFNVCHTSKWLSPQSSSSNCSASFPCSSSSSYSSSSSSSFSCPPSYLICILYMYIPVLQVHILHSQGEAIVLLLSCLL